MDDEKRPYRIFGVCDGYKGFRSGHFDKTEAEHACDAANKDAVKLGIKTRYVLEVFEVPATEQKSEQPTA
jgi:hypothetical protein